jgi:hypothetical protein
MRRMLRVATGVAVVMPVVTIGSARALDGHGHLETISITGES